MYKAFEKWLNGVLDENVPLSGVAINFNLYEETDLITWHKWMIFL